MHYLTIDGMMSGTGIRNAIEGGYIQPSRLELSTPLQSQISAWLARYRDAHFRQYGDPDEVARLDAEGLAIAHSVRAEVPNSKVDYFSSATMAKTAL